MKNPILEEIRRYREEHAAKFNYDITRMGDESRRLEPTCGHDVVSISRTTGEVTVLFKAPRDSEPSDLAT